MNKEMVKQLRIGNMHKGVNISHPRLGIYSVEIDGTHFNYITSYGIHLVDEGKMEFEPIPLTEGWLKAFGFEKINSPSNGEHWNLDGVKIWQDEQSFYHINSENCTHFDSVHSLQNWYFAISDEELILK